MDLKSLDELQLAVIEEAEKNHGKKEEKYHFDKMKLFFGEPHVVHEIKINQPTIGDILDVGWRSFSSAISPFISNSTSIRLMLWNMGEKNWCKISDIEVYNILTQNLNLDQSGIKILFPEKTLTDYKLVKYTDKNDQSKFGLYNQKVDDLITDDEYMEIAEFIRTVTNIHPKVEHSTSKIARKWMIQEDQMNLVNKKQDSDYTGILPVVSALTNYPGFKYKLEELRQVNLYRFYDAAQRVQIYEQTRALMNGSYSGFADLSKVDKDLFNFMRAINQ